jgi:hypothetical protein
VAVDPCGALVAHYEEAPECSIFAKQALDTLHGFAHQNYTHFAHTETDSQKLGNVLKTVPLNSEC